MSTTAPAVHTSVASTSSHRGAVARLEVSGDLDAGTTPAFADRLATELASDPDLLLVDLSGVEFCSSSGVSALAEAATSARGDGVDFRVVARRAVSRVIDILNLADQVPVYPTVDAALASLPGVGARVS